MKFTELILDKNLLRSQINSSCTKCDGKAMSKICAACSHNAQLMVHTFRSKFPSVVMQSTTLYDELFFPGPVSYFMVIMSYIATKHLIDMYCNPLNSDFPPMGAEWHHGAQKFRVKAKAFMDSRKEQFTLTEKEAKTPAEYLAALEMQIIYGITVMAEVTLGDTDLGERINTKFTTKFDLFQTRNIVPVTIERGKRDMLAQKLEADKIWNDEWKLRVK